MRISAKGRYALAATIELAEHYNSDELIPIITISERLDISKIYLEQVFSLLKRSGLVNSTKGSHGGYKLTRKPSEITVYDIITATEAALFEEVKEPVSAKVPEIDRAINQCIYEPLDEAIKAALTKTNLQDLVNEVEKQREDTFMFYI